MTIRTRWHKALEAIQNKRVAINIGTVPLPQDPIEPEDEDHRAFDAIMPEAVLDLVKIINGVPKFYLDKEMVAVLTRDDVVASLKLLVDHKLATLPFPMLLAEYDRVQADDTVVREFVFLQTRDEERLAMGEEKFHQFRANLLRLKKHPKTGIDYLVLSPSTFYVDFDTNVNGNGTFGFSFGATEAGYVRPTKAVLQAVQDTHEKDLQVVDTALSAVVLLLHTKGVIKEVIETERLNKHRIKSGKPPVPSHSVIRIGHVYDRQGKAHNVSAGTTGRKMPIHLRRAHTRMQRYGQGRAQTKMILIHAVFVNYEGEGEAPTYTVKL